MRQKKQKFSIRVEKNGVTVPVYRVCSGNGYTGFAISYRENGEQKNKGFATVCEAAKRAAGHIASGNAEAVKLRPEDAQAYVRAAAVLKPFRIRVDAVASEYAAAVKLLGKTAGPVRNWVSSTSARSGSQNPRPSTRIPSNGRRLMTRT